ncbi:MAG TPA: hypothetical protein VLJ42_09420, partial [Solirubrobacteraceae bacterium]|nr:hypothetical protein [Solirubrobacteraceae bacterium]
MTAPATWLTAALTVDAIGARPAAAWLGPAGAWLGAEDGVELVAVADGDAWEAGADGVWAAAEEPVACAGECALGAAGEEAPAAGGTGAAGVAGGGAGWVIGAATLPVACVTCDAV